MPLTIKQNGFKFKDSNGDYQGVDVIAETALATQLAAIQGEGTTQIGAVQAKGTEVIASIPADYTDLTEEVDEIKSVIGEYSGEIMNMYLNGTSWVNSYFSMLVPVSPGDAIEILGTNDGSNSPIRMLKNVTFPIASGGSVEASTAHGWTDLINVYKNTTLKATAPSDAKYLYFYAGVNSSYDRLPQKININGVDCLKNITGNLMTVQTKISESLSEEEFSENIIKGSYSNGAWQTTIGYMAFIKVNPGDDYEITGGNPSSPYLGLKTVSIPLEVGDTRDFSAQTGWTDQRVVNNGVVDKGTIPSDVYYLSFYAGTDTTYNRLPQSIVINGVDVLLSVLANIGYLRGEMSKDTDKIRNLQRPEKIRTYSHAGYSATYPTNSLMAFRDSKVHGFNWVETDIQFTSDDVPVLCHDDAFYRYAKNSDGTDVSESLKISELTYEQLLEYDFGLPKSASLAGMKITTFEQLMVTARNMDLHVSIEIKTNKTPTNAQIDILFEIIDSCHMRKNVNFCSAVYNALKYVHSVDPTIELINITSITSGHLQDTAGLRGMNQVAIAVTNPISDANILLAQNAGIPVLLYTISADSDITGANPYISQFTSDGPIAETVLNDYELAQMPS